MPSKYTPKSKSEKPQLLPDAMTRLAIITEFKNGLSIECLAGKYELNNSTIQRIIRWAFNA